MPTSRDNQIFVVEDSDILRPIIAETIRYWPGFEVCGVAATAEEAYENLAGCSPDVAVIDISLPEMLGTELVRRLTARDPDLRCVMYTGYDSPILRLQAERAGAADYVVKGDPVALHAALERTLQTSCAQLDAA